MQRHLASMGVAAQKIVRKQQSGEYVADFFVPGMTDPIAPAQVWARRIKDALPAARIVETLDTVADWRPDSPIIHAIVIFRAS